MSVHVSTGMKHEPQANGARWELLERNIITQVCTHSTVRFDLSIISNSLLTAQYLPCVFISMPLLN